MNPTLRTIGISREAVQRLTGPMRRTSKAGCCREPKSCKYPRETILRAVELRDGGASYTAIAEETGLPKGSICRVLEMGRGMA